MFTCRCFVGLLCRKHQLTLSHTASAAGRTTHVQPQEKRFFFLLLPYSSSKLHFSRDFIGQRISILGKFQHPLDVPLLNYHKKQELTLTASLHTGTYFWRKLDYFLGHAVKRGKKEPITRYKNVVLIDDSGTNLGEMDSKTALGMASGRGLEVKLVRDKSEKFPLAVFRMVSRKDIFDESKKKKKLSRKKPQDVIKEVRFSTQISDHDFDIRIRHMKSMLEKGNTVHVSADVKAKGKWIEPEKFVEMRNMRGVILDRVEERLAGLGVRTEYKGGSKKGMEVTVFKAVHRPVQEEGGSDGGGDGVSDGGDGDGGGGGVSDGGVSDDGGGVSDGGGGGGDGSDKGGRKNSL